MHYYSGIQSIELAKESQRGKPGEPVPWNQTLIQMVFNSFFGMRKFSYLKAEDLIEELYWDTSIYANETMNFQIWPSAMIVGAGSFWNYQSKLTPDSKEFLMMIDTQHKVSLYVRFIEQLICPDLIGRTYCLLLVRSQPS